MAAAGPRYSPDVAVDVYTVLLSSAGTPAVCAVQFSWQPGGAVGYDTRRRAFVYTVLASGLELVLPEPLLFSKEQAERLAAALSGAAPQPGDDLGPLLAGVVHALLPVAAPPAEASVSPQPAGVHHAGLPPAAPGGAAQWLPGGAAAGRQRQSGDDDEQAPSTPTARTAGQPVLTPEVSGGWAFLGVVRLCQGWAAPVRWCEAPAWKGGPRVAAPLCFGGRRAVQLALWCFSTDPSASTRHQCPAPAPGTQHQHLCQHPAPALHLHQHPAPAPTPESAPAPSTRSCT